MRGWAADVSGAHVVVFGSTPEPIVKVGKGVRCVAVLELDKMRPAVTLVPLPR